MRKLKSMLKYPLDKHKNHNNIVKGIIEKLNNFENKLNDVENDMLNHYEIDYHWLLFKKRIKD